MKSSNFTTKTYFKKNINKYDVKKYKYSAFDRIRPITNKKIKNTKNKATTLYDYITEIPIVRKTFTNNT